MNYNIDLHSLVLNMGNATTAFSHQVFYGNGQRILVMKDETQSNNHLSLTNACPTVVSYLFSQAQAENQPTPNRVIYCDSEGEWAEVLLRSDRFAGFKFLRGSCKDTSIGEAIDLCLYNSIH